MNEKLVLSKLAGVLSAQQKIITKLAQATSDQSRDPIIDYITHNLIPVVAANMLLPNVKVRVSKTPKVPAGSTNNGTFVNEQPEGYLAYITGVPANKRELFINTMNNQVSKQKPDLAGNLSTFFED